jgi:hypothetical protein
MAWRQRPLLPGAPRHGNRSRPGGYLRRSGCGGSPLLPRSRAESIQPVGVAEASRSGSRWSRPGAASTSSSSPSSSPRSPRPSARAGAQQDRLLLPRCPPDRRRDRLPAGPNRGNYIGASEENSFGIDTSSRSTTGSACIRRLPPRRQRCSKRSRRRQQPLSLIPCLSLRVQFGTQTSQKRTRESPPNHPRPKNHFAQGVRMSHDETFMSRRETSTACGNSPEIRRENRECPRKIGNGRKSPVPRSGEAAIRAGSCDRTRKIA